MRTVLADLSDADLVSHVRQLLASGARLEVETLIALNVMHERKLYEPAGFGSFHVYCVNVLRMSDDTAGRRSKVGRLLRLYPAVVRELIETQAASVTALSKLEPVITDENAERLLNEVRGKTVREVELMVVREVPKPPVQSGFRTVFAPALTLNAEQATKSVDSSAVRDEEAPGVTSEEKIRIDAVSAPANKAPPRCKKKPIEPRAVDHYAFSANMNEVTKTKLKETMDVGNFESYDALFAAAVEALRTELLKKKYAQVAKPRKRSYATKTAFKIEASSTDASSNQASSNEASNSEAPATETRAAEDASSASHKREAIPASVRREVYLRDGGRCTFEGTEGRCTETRFVEFHHRITVADGGPSTAENLTLHCHSRPLAQLPPSEARFRGRAYEAVGACPRRSAYALNTINRDRSMPNFFWAWSR